MLYANVNATVIFGGSQPKTLYFVVNSSDIYSVVGLVFKPCADKSYHLCIYKPVISPNQTVSFEQFCIFDKQKMIKYNIK